LRADLLFKRFEIEGYKLIAEMIAAKQEEHLYLDFKTKADSNKPSLADEDKKTLRRHFPDSQTHLMG